MGTDGAGGKGSRRSQGTGRSRGTAGGDTRGVARREARHREQSRKQLIAFTGLHISTTTFERLLAVGPSNRDILLNGHYHRFVGSKLAHRESHPLWSALSALFTRASTHDSHGGVIVPLSPNNAAPTAGGLSTQSSHDMSPLVQPVAKSSLLYMIRHDAKSQRICAGSAPLLELWRDEQMLEEFLGAREEGEDGVEGPEEDMQVVGEAKEGSNEATKEAKEGSVGRIMEGTKEGGDGMISVGELFDLIQDLGAEEALEDMISNEEATFLDLEARTAALLLGEERANSVAAVGGESDEMVPPAGRRGTGLEGVRELAAEPVW